MRGKMVPASEAERIGLLNYCVPKDEVLPKAREIVRELADGAPWAIRWTKLSVNKILKDQMNLVLETSMALEKYCFHMDDHKEATRAFKEKRKPTFTGR
jgi:enoyl-CoA hydratase